MKLSLIWRSIIAGTDMAYCMRCRTPRKVVKLGNAETQTTRGIVTRQKGLCTTCGKRTSKVLSHSKAAN